MVWVPAVMSAGVVFSVATLVRDVLHRGSGVVIAREARLRGALIGESTLVGADQGSNAASSRDAAPRWAFAVVSLSAGALTVYLIVGATGNYFRSGSYVGDIAWVWSLFVLGALGAALIAAAAGAVVIRHPVVPSFAWTTLAPTPLFGVASHRRAFTASRWVAVAAGVAFTFLAVLATWPDKLEPFDQPVSGYVDHESLLTLESVGQWYGNTLLSFALVVVVAVTASRCRRLGALFLVAIVVSIVLSNSVRVIVLRPRPGDPSGTLDGFPSGHMVQVALFAVLVPLAVREVTRRRWVEWLSFGLLSLASMLLAMQIVAADRHAPTDVIAGVLLGVAVGGWIRAIITDETAHRTCRGCVFGELVGGEP